VGDTKVLSFKRVVPSMMVLSGIIALGACEQGSGGGESVEPAPTEGAPTPAPTSAPADSSSAVPAAEEALAKKDDAAPSRLDPATGEHPSTARIAPTVAPTAATGTTETPVGPSTVVLRPETLELGEIPTNDAKSGTVTLVNTGDTPRKVLDCKVSCGCTTTNCQKGKTLEPGEELEIEIKLSGGSRPTRLTKTVTFLVSDQAPMRMQVSGTAVSYVTVTPDKLDPDIHPEGQLTLKSIDDTPFTIKSMYPPIIEDFATEASAEQTVSIDWQALRDRGHRSTKILFTLDHPKCTKVNAVLSAAAVQTVRAVKTGSPDGTPAPKPTRFDLDRMLKNGETDEVLALIDDGSVNVNGVDAAEQTPLIKAARWGNVDVMQALLDASADISAGDNIGRTPIIYACQSKNAEAVRLLLDSGADINARDQIGNTVMCWAAGFGTAEIVQEIIDAGGDIESSGPMMGFTPLIWASLSGEPEAVKLLIDAGANIEAADVLQGATPIMHAARTGGPENVKVLLENGAKLEARDKDEMTPLLIAASNAGADVAMVRMLLDAGADVNARSAAGYNALELAEKRTDVRAAAVIEALKTAMPSE
jgi:ankyrin repeat protein